MATRYEVETQADAIHAADRLAALDDVIAKIEAARDAVTSVKTSAAVHHEAGHLNAWASSCADLAADDSDGPLADLLSDLRDERERIDEAYREWETRENYGPAVGAHAGSAIG